MNAGVLSRRLKNEVRSANEEDYVPMRLLSGHGRGWQQKSDYE